ncbi:MAG: response regulator [Candidatus Omnitrophota bacterium]
MSKKILIIDDEEDFRSITSVSLEHNGYMTETARNGKEGIGAYLASIYTNAPIDLILLDIRMPVLSGLEVLDIIRREERDRGVGPGREVPIIVLTAYYEPWMNPLITKGGTDYIVKSPSDYELFRKIEERLSDNKDKAGGS